MGAVSDYYEFSALDQISIQNFDSLEQQEFLNKSLGGVQ